MFKVSEILEVCNGELLMGNPEQTVDQFYKDSREKSPDSMYLAIVGENFDGNQYFEDALNNGAIGCIINKNIEEEISKKYKDKIIIKVEDTIKAIQNLAKYKREQYNIPVVAITGSVGKTSTKDIVKSVMSKKYTVLSTEGNENNEIGLPLTLLKLKEHNAIVLEIGMNHFGEIRTLTNIAKPTVVIINNIGTAHIGNLGSREGILKAKLEILEGLKENGVFILNNDNDLLSLWNKENKEKYNTTTFGIENHSDFMAHNIISNENGSKYDINIDDNTYNVEVPVGGEHFILNSLCAFSVGKILNIEEGKIIDAIKEFELTKMRMDIIKKNDIVIINDAYNASYDSMKYTLKYLGCLLNKRKIAVLGDMLELGEYSKELHEKVGKEVVKNKIDILIIIGENSKYIASIAIEKGMNENDIYKCETIGEVITEVKRIVTTW